LPKSFGGLAIDRLIQVVARRVIALGSPPLDDLVLGESFVKPTFSDSAGTPVLMKLYWSLRTKALRSGSGSESTSIPSGRATRFRIVREIGLFESLHDQALQREERQEHVGVEVGDDLAARHREAVREVTRSEQTLLFRGDRGKHQASLVATSAAAPAAVSISVAMPDALSMAPL
jgi:hypothetical protein